MKRKIEILVVALVVLAGGLYLNTWSDVSSEELPESVYLRYNSARNLYRLHSSDDGGPVITFKRKRFYLKGVEVTEDGILIKLDEFANWNPEER